MEKEYMPEEFSPEEEEMVPQEEEVTNEVIGEEDITVIQVDEEIEKEDDETNSETTEVVVSPYKKVLKNILSWVWTILLAFFIAIVINSYVIRASEVYGRSMYPTLEQGDVVFISRLPYIFGEPKHDDIVVFDSTFEHRNFLTEVEESLKYNMITQKFFNTQATNKYWIKRVVGVPGDVIEVKEGKLYRNGELLVEDYINKEEQPRYGDFSFTIEEGYIFCMGDNRNHSEDSRARGPVPINDVLGKVVFGAG